MYLVVIYFLHSPSAAWNQGLKSGSAAGIRCDGFGSDINSYKSHAPACFCSAHSLTGTREPEMFPCLTKLYWGRLLWIERQKEILFLEVFQEIAPAMPPNVMLVSKLDAFVMVCRL